MTYATEVDSKKVTSLEPVEAGSRKGKLAPVFVEAETMLEKFAEISKNVAMRAFEFFRERGGELGKDVEDWFKAENEILRPVPIEMTESDKNIFVSAAVPGFKPNEIEVSVKDNALIISGKSETKEKEEDANTIIREWRSNQFLRQLTLPSRILPDKVEAKLTDGMLKLTLPKAAEENATKVAVASA